jgi:chorismate mutase
VSPAFLRALYELIITETCRLEDEIIGARSRSA